MARIFAYFDVLVIAAVVALTFGFGVETPDSDDWDIIPVLEKIRAGTLDWKTIDTPYAGHKIVVPYSVMADLIRATNWNSYVLRAAGLFFAIVGWMAVRPIAVKEGRLIEAALFYWSLNQWAVWFWSWMCMATIAMCGVLWSLRLFASSRYRDFFLAAVCGIIGIYSWGAGVALLPAAVYLVYFRPRPLAQKIIFVPLVVAVACLFLWHPATPEDLEHGRNYLMMPYFFLLALGAPAGFVHLGIAAVAALAGLAMLLVFGRPSWEKLKTNPFSVGLFIASFSMLGILCIIRGAGSQIDEGTNSRYGEMCSLAWVAIILLANWSGWRKYVLLALVLLCLVRDVSKLSQIEAYRRNALAGVAGVRAGTEDRFLLKGAHTSREQFDHDTARLREWHYSFFRNP